MVIGTFGVGFAAGVLTTQFSGPAPKTVGGGGPEVASLPAPGLGLDAEPALGLEPEPALALEQEAAAVAFVPGTWFGNSASIAAETTPNAALSEQAASEPPPLTAQLSATETLQALPEPAQIAALPDSLSSDAASAYQARPEKGALLERPSSTEQILVRRGDTLMNILIRARIEQTAANAAVASLRDVYDPRRLRAGQQLALTALSGSEADQRELLRLALDLDFDHQIEVIRRADGEYDAAQIERPQHREMVRRAGTINDSLYLAADRVALPHDVTYGLVKLFSWDVDFQRDLRRGDSFETLFEEVSLEDGSGASRGGDLLYGGLTLSGQILDAYRFEVEDGEVEYFDRTGRSLRKFLLRTPVDGARLSSGFGMRRHPILGYSRMHKGVDFAAPSGTPIYAAGSGRVASAGRNGGYGNYIQIRHSGEYSTAYGHMSRFAKGISAGIRVQQGQVIGYVGTTGRSTGPHLHYEILRNSAQINPLSVKQPPNTQLAGADLERFQAEVDRIDRLRADLANGTQLASRAGATSAAN